MTKECYRVFECTDFETLDYIPKVLYKSEYMLFAHSFAYDAWMKSNKEKMFIVNQANGMIRATTGVKDRVNELKDKLNEREN